MTDPTTCERVRLGAPELALGVLVGIERAEMLDHLETCPDCRAEVGRFAAAADAVLDLAPVADPPAGFEVRVLARRTASRSGPVEAPAGTTVAASTPSRWRRRVVRSVAGIAAAVLVVTGIAIGSITAPARTGGSPGVRTAALSFDGAARGNVAVAFGHPSWMFMTVEMPRWSGWVRCVVSEGGGREVTVGRFWLDGGYGGWAAPLGVPASDVRGARLEAADGSTIAAATLPAV